jgi:hypothetical protein
MQRMGRRLGAIALLAMLVRAVVPAGYMLAEADTGSGRHLVVQMCRGHETTSRVIDLDTGKQIDAAKIAKTTGKTGKSDPKLAPCVFAGAPVLAQPAAVAEPVEFISEWAVKFDVSRDIRPGRGIPAPPPPSTGPPSLI